MNHSSNAVDIKRAERRVLFASMHSVVDYSNGAAVATLDILTALASSGFSCHAYCTSVFDFDGNIDPEIVLAQRCTEIRESVSKHESGSLQVLHATHGSIAIRVVRLKDSRASSITIKDVSLILDSYAAYLDAFLPDVVLSYGGDQISEGMISLAKARNIPVVFILHNLCYRRSRLFDSVTRCVVPSRFAHDFYKSREGIETSILPNPVNWSRVYAPDRRPRCLTFVNPTPEKGILIFVAIAHELARLRPDIELLVVESRGDRGTLARYGLGKNSHVNVKLMRNTADPRCFWSMTRAVLLPSVCWENQPMVAIEGMINGVPTIGSARGGIPETLGSSGFLCQLPDRITADADISPDAIDVKQWVDIVVRLWDDHAFYGEQSVKAATEARRWQAHLLRDAYASFFVEICNSRANVSVEGGNTLSVANAAMKVSMSPSRQVWSHEAPFPNLRQCPGIEDSLSVGSLGGAETRLTFVSCVSDKAVLQRNLLASPCLGEGSRHELFILAGSASAAEAIRSGYERASNEWVVICHQDVYLPLHWDTLLIAQLELAERMLGPFSVAGVYGVGPVVESMNCRPFTERFGWVYDRGSLLRHSQVLPASVSTLDELVLVLRKPSGFDFDSSLGFHLYGADLCLQSRLQGQMPVVVAAPCYHNSDNVYLPESFYRSARVFANKWSACLPIATPCVIFDRLARMYLLGNAPLGGPSVAHAVGPSLLS